MEIETTCCLHSVVGLICSHWLIFFLVTNAAFSEVYFIENTHVPCGHLSYVDTLYADQLRVFKGH